MGIAVPCPAPVGLDPGGGGGGGAGGGVGSVAVPAGEYAAGVRQRADGTPAEADRGAAEAAAAATTRQLAARTAKTTFAGGAVSNLDRPSNAARSSLVGRRTSRAGGVSSWADPPDGPNWIRVTENSADIRH